jgi:Ras-related protein Rab-8A
MGILLVYDVSDVNSFTNIRNWMKNIEQHASTNVVKALVGNKCDLKESERAVSYSQGKSLAEEYGIPFFETSAKTGEQVQEVFTGLAKQIYTKIKDQALDTQNNNRISIGPPRRHLTSTAKRSCC